MTIDPRFSYVDYARSYTAASGQAISGPGNESSINGDADFPAGNAFSWDQSLIWKSASGTGACGIQFELDNTPSGTAAATSVFARNCGGSPLVNCIGIWMPSIDTGNTFAESINTGTFEIEILYGSNIAGLGNDQQFNLNNLLSGEPYAQAYGGRMWIFKLSSAVNVNTNKAWKIWLISPGSVDTFVFSFAKVCLLYMQDEDELGISIPSPISYSYENRDTRSELESGGISQYKRPYARRVGYSAVYQKRLQGVDFIRGAFEDQEPYVFSMDYGNNKSPNGQHLHTFPVVTDDSIDLGFQQVLSTDVDLRASFNYRWREWL